jgi:hypothetical protein
MTPGVAGDIVDIEFEAELRQRHTVTARDAAAPFRYGLRARADDGHAVSLVQGGDAADMIGMMVRDQDRGSLR